MSITSFFIGFFLRRRFRSRSNQRGAGKKTPRDEKGRAAEASLACIQNADRERIIFPCSADHEHMRVGNLTRLIHTLLYV